MHKLTKVACEDSSSDAKRCSILLSADAILCSIAPIESSILSTIYGSRLENTFFTKWKIVMKIIISKTKSTM